MRPDEFQGITHRDIFTTSLNNYEWEPIQGLGVDFDFIGT